MQSRPAMPEGRLSFPPRRAVASYSTYPEAQRAVDYLADQRFPVEHLALVGEGLEYIEQVTGRLGYWQAAYNGAASGAVVGIVIGFLLGLFNLAAPVGAAFALAAWGFLIGVVAGATLGVVLHACSRGRRDFASVSSIHVDHYTLLVEQAVADEAARALERMPQ